MPSTGPDSEPQRISTGALWNPLPSTVVTLPEGPEDGRGEVVAWGVHAHARLAPARRCRSSRRLPITGDSHGRLLAPLERLAAELGYEVAYERLPDGMGGFCDLHARRIVVSSEAELNRRVAVLVHEIAHALGAGYRELGRELAEVVVESVAYVVCAGAGLDVSGEAVPYVAGWGGVQPLERARYASALIDELARRIEEAIGTASS